MQYGRISCISIGPNQTTYLNSITNPTPPQMRPIWLGQQVYSNHQGSRMHPNYRGSRVHPNNRGSWMHPNGGASRVWPGWGRRCAGALPSWLALCAPGLGFARLKTSRQIEMQHVFYIALQHACYTCNMHTAQISILCLTCIQFRIQKKISHLLVGQGLHTVPIASNLKMIIE